MTLSTKIKPEGCLIQLYFTYINHKKILEPLDPFLPHSAMIEFDNELMLCVFFNALKCSHLYRKLHKCIELRNNLLSCVFQCVLAFSNNSKSSQGIEFCNDLLPCFFQFITAFFYLSHNICNSTEFGYNILSYVFKCFNVLISVTMFTQLWLNKI